MNTEAPLQVPKSAVALLTVWVVLVGWIGLRGTEVWAAERPSSAFTVSIDQPLSQRPISPLICGNLIELGLGRQSEGMRVQMLYNGSFEDIPFFKSTFL